MTISSDRPDGVGAPAHKSRRRRPSISGTAQAAVGNAPSDSPVLAPSPPPIEQLDDEDAAAAVGKPSTNAGDAGLLSYSRSRSSSSTQKIKRGTAGGSSGTRSRRTTAASSIITAAKNARAGLLDARDSLATSIYASSSNNNEDDEEDCFQDEDRGEEGEARDTRRRRSRSRSRRSSAATGPELVTLPGREPEATTEKYKIDRRGTRPVLPSRSRRYRQLSAGPDKSSIAQHHADRPPSRQRHAFPTHLIDANAFCAPTTGGTPVDIDNDDCIPVAEVVAVVSHSSQVVMSSAKNERPPSRYMTKSNRRAQAGSAASHSRSVAVEAAAASSPQTEVNNTDPDAEGDTAGRCVHSRRLAVEFGSFSCNQAHHDPKTDGFADVDESIPPPFRIEITTESSEPPSPSSASSSSTPPSSFNEPGFIGKVGGRPPRRAASFSGNQHHQQLGKAAKRVGEGRPPKPRHTLKSSFNPLQWFGEDDQINNPDNFETVITVASPPPSDPGLDDDSEDPSNERDEDEDVEDASQMPLQWPSMQPPPTASVPHKAGGHSWMVRSLNNSSGNNTKSLFKSDVPDYDSMDADTAIAETPLYDGSNDFMAIATQMSDLRLDDYSLADVMATTNSGISGANNTGIGGASSASGLGGAAPPLHTSLGRDFLSLFAQH